MKVVALKHALDNRFGPDGEFSPEELKQLIDTFESEQIAETISVLSQSAIDYLLDGFVPGITVEVGLNFVKIFNSKGFSEPERLADCIFRQSLAHREQSRGSFGFADFEISTKMGYMVAYIGKNPME